MLTEDTIYLLSMLIIWNCVKHQVNSLDTCKSIALEDDDGINLHWSETPVGELRPSTPICIDDDDNILPRKCMENGFWKEFDPHKCTFYTTTKFISCPYGMEKLRLGNRNVCLKVTTATQFKNVCLKFGSTKSILDLASQELKALVNHLKTKKGLTALWLPMKRDEDYYPYQWKIAGRRWGDSVHLDCYDYPVNDSFKENCLKMDIEGPTQLLISENCNKKLAEVCIHEESSVLPLACEKGQTSRYSYHENKCYYVEKSERNPTKQLFRITNLHSRTFLNDLINSFGLSKKDRCLVDFGTSRSYFTDLSHGNYTVINNKGKWMMDKKFTCIVYEETIDIQIPEIYLKFDTGLGKMLLTIYSEEFLWKEDSNSIGVKCFTVADNELVKVVEVKSKLWSQTIQKFDVKLFDRKKSSDIKKSIYELGLIGNGPGIYWCEGHVIKSFDFIKSKEIFARKKLDGIVLAMTIQLLVPESRKPIYDGDFLSSITKKIIKAVRGSGKLDFYEQFVVDNIQDIRVMKILNFDETSNSLTAIYHTTILNRASRNEESSEEYKDFMEKYEDKFDNMKAILSHQLISFLEKIFEKVGGSELRLLAVTSTEYCLPDSVKNPNPITSILVWEQAFIGQTLPPTELCLYESGMPLTRKCKGDFLHGGTWQNLTREELQCIDSEKLSLHTKRLHSFNKVFRQNETHDIIENMTSISSHYDQLIAADLFYISKTVQQITSMSNVTQSSNLNSTDLDDRFNLTIILNNIMNVNESMIQLSQLKLNTTSILLDSYDNLINSLSTNYSIYATINNNLFSNSLNETEGTFIMRTEKIVVFICDPGRMNVSGVALVRNRESVDETSLMDYRVEKLYATQTIDDILSIYEDTLEIASFLPLKLLERIDEIKNSTNNDPLKIVIKIFYNDKMFKENRLVSKYKSQSKIISVSIPGHDQNLPVLLPIMMKKNNSTAQSDDEVCGYWEFQPNGTSSESSEWMQQGCEFLGVSKYDENLALCGCSHLTHFAYLIMGTYVHDVEPGNDVVVRKYSAHHRALNTITLLGSSLSIIGLIGIFVTAICFKTWREKASTKVLLQLSLAIALQMAIFCLSSTEKYSSSIDTDFEKVTCIILGSSLHYSVLVTFSWMLITAFLQFKRYVVVLGNLKPERFFLKSFLVGWGSPLIPIIILMIIDPSLYIPENYGICYPQGFAFYFGVMLPVGVIVVANLIVFIIVLYNILYKVRKSKPGDSKHIDHSMTPSQLRVSVFLFFLLGLTWIFGFLALTSASIFFSYLFCLTATIQGFVLFIYFIILDPITRSLWRESLRFNQRN